MYMDAICQRRGLWWILYADLWQPFRYLLCYPLHCKSLKHRNISQITNPSLFSISILSFINEMLSCEIWKNRRKSHFIPLTIVTGRCLGFPDSSCLKLFLRSPPTHPSQDWRGAVRYSKDSFSFLILHGSNSLIPCGSEPEH